MLTLLILTIRRNLKRNFNLYKRIGLIILIVLFFLSNYHICNYFYPLDNDESVELWWLLKLDIYAVIIALCFYLASLEPNNNIKLRLIEKFISNVGVGLAVSNAIDRRTHDRMYYTSADLAMLIVVLLVSYYDFKKLNKQYHTKK